MWTYQAIAHGQRVQAGWKRLLDLNEWSCDVWGLAERDSLLGELKGNENA
jgi:hypothetical protein